MTRPWLLSAPSGQDLRDRAARLRQRVEHGTAGPREAAESLASARSAATHRAVLLPSGGAWLEPLAAVAEGCASPRAVRGVAADEVRPVFVFPGQGAVFPGMCAGLLAASPVFARRMGECADALAPHVDFSLVDVLKAEEWAPELWSPAVVEPVLFAIMVSLAELWRSHGVEPGAVAGFSLGEIAAAQVAGALPLDEAARVAALWSRAHVPMVGQGCMAMVGLTVAEVEARFGAPGADASDAVDVAGVFAPRSVVIAGAGRVVDRIVEELRDEGTYAQKLSVDFPAHSPRVEPQREALLASLGDVAPRPTHLPFYSSTTGGRLDTRELDAGFWYRNLRSPVMFEQAARAVLADGHGALLELSAHPGLVRPMNEIVAAAGRGVPVIGTLRRDQQGPARFVASLAEAWVHGVPVDWDRELPESGGAGGPTATGPGTAVPAAPFSSTAAAGPGGADHELVDAIVDGIVGELEGGRAPGTALDPALREANLFDLGLDSVRLVALQAKLERRLGVRLESTCVIDHPAPAALVDELRRTIAARDGVENAEAPRTRSADRAARDQAAPAPAPSSGPVAVVGMGMRLPGGIGSREELWQVLSERIDVVEPVPADRWAHSPLDLTEVTTTQGGYLRDIDRFDPGFFGISPSEAELIDPQQRLLLELTWEAFEDAGLDPYAAGSTGRVGTFVGIYNNDYSQVGRNLGYSHEAYTYTGNMANAAAGRISYTFGFTGPSMAIDTACSSSLYALHLAGRELRHGGCDLVVAAGVNLILSPEGHLSWSRLGALAPSGRCRSFDDGADGYIRSEGGAVVVLKRLADAERDGDDILAVLHGSAISHNGRSGGFTVPSSVAQSQVIKDAMAEAGVGIEDVSYVEAHGSGTPIGDPQEINSLARVFAGRTEKIGVGSVKSNLGHLESAAGMAALCKIVTCLRNKRLPATLHFRTGNHLIDWDEAPVEVVAEEVPWEPSGGPRLAGISSFGVSGTNAHVIVGEYEGEKAPRRPGGVPGAPRLLPVSAKSAGALRTALNGLADWSVGVGAELDDIAHTLGRRRVAKHRRALVCATADDLRAAAEAGPAEAAPDAGHGPAHTVFVFSGQGTQYPGMARELYAHAEVFRRELDEIDAEFRRVAGISVLDVMFAEETGEADEAAQRFGSPLYTQPMIFAVGLALARYWASWGVTPAAVIGHSIGEYAAACFAGVMSREQAVELVAHRARVVEESSADGAMATLLCSVRQARELLAGHPDVSLAAVNASENVTLSGPADSLAAVLKAARRRRVFTERLQVSHPFHSELMAPAAERLHDLIRDRSFGDPSITWISAQTAGPVVPGAPIDAGHWSRHLVEPVRFRDAVASAVGSGLRTFVEIGATATLGGLVAQEFGDDLVVLPSLRKGRPDVRQFLETAGRLWELGAELDPGHLAGPGRLLHDLPRTPFDRQRTWYRDRTVRGGATMTGRTEGLTADGTPPGGTVSSDAAVTGTDAPETRRAEKEAVEEVVVTALSQVTGVAATDLDRRVELFSLGVDSLMLVQLGKRIQRNFGLDIPLTTFFESLHTVGQVADFVLRNRPEPEPSPEPDRRAVPAQPHQPDRQLLPDQPLQQPRPASGIEAVIQSQLDVMRRQLQVLGGAAPAGPGADGASVDRAETDHADDHADDRARDLVPGRPAPAVRRVGTYNNNISLRENRLTDRQQRFVADFVARYTARTTGSKEHAGAHRERLADWINSLNFDPSLRETAYPLVSARSEGAEFWDVDGNGYVDTGIGYGVHFFGHRPDFVVQAIQDQLAAGFELGPQNKVAGEVAELVHEMTGAERVAFCNTGTEAVMVSLRLARAVSGRDRIVRFTDSYHGGFDGVLAESDGTGSVPLTIGIPQAMIEDTLVLRYGAEESLESIRRHGGELAAVLVEPVQSRNPGLQPAGFLRELRRICTEHGIALIFDEMIVGFRLEPGGAQAYFGVESDMSLYGKLVGGGMPVGIVAGRARYLDAVDGGAFSDASDAPGSRPAVPTTFFAGTFCKHPLTMAACRAVLTNLKEDGAERIAALNRFTDDFVRRANDWFDREDVPVRLSHCASMYKYEPVAPSDVATMTLTTNLFFKLLAHHGVFVWERRAGYFSLAHTEDHKDRILDAFRTAVEEIRAGGFDFRRAASAAPAGDGAALAPAAFGGPLAVSAEEKRLYVLSRMRGGNEAYQVPARLRFDGPLDPDRVDAAFRAITRRHPKLRCGYGIGASDVVCHVLPDAEPEFHLFDGASAEEVAEVMNAPLDLSRAPLWRYGIVVRADGGHDLVMSFHHIVVDGRALELIIDELADHLTHGRLTAAEEPADYAEYVRLRSGLPARPDHEDHRRWWLREFATLPPPLAVPTDAPLPAVNDFDGRHHYSEIDPEVHRAVTEVVRRHRTTPFLFYLSLWSVLLARSGGESDLCVGVPLDQRALGPFDGTVGMFAQSLPLRLRPTPGTRLSDYLRQVRDTGLAAIEHAPYPYDTLIEELDLERDSGRNALFDTMFIYTNARERAHRFGALTATGEDFGMRGSMLALTLELVERDGGLFVDLNHSGVFGERRIADLMRRFHTLVVEAVSDPDRLIGQIPLIDDATAQRLLSRGAGPALPHVPGVGEQFGRAFTAYAHRPAIRHRGEVTTYAQLDERVGRLAALLRDRGLGKGDLVGLLLPRSPELVAAMLAVRRVRAAWLPMDPTDPAERLRSVIGAAAPATVLCSPETAEILGQDTATTIRDEDLPAAPAPGTEAGGPDDLAYVIFTSGSTGRPKGVTVTDRALANFLSGMPGALDWEEGATVACLTTPSFDIHLLETLMTLVTGGTVAMADEEDAGTPAAIAEFVAANGVRYLQMTPSRLRMLGADPDAARAALAPLERLVVGGEAFPEELLPDLRAWSPGRIFNVYGPTETCIWSSVKEVTRAASVSIGTPIANTTFHVLDDGLQLVAEGTAGDLWIGGQGVSPGYLNRPELTREAFRDNPFGEGRIYRSGDRAVWRDGEVHCLGRTDNQVKIRGYRIELEEIEQAVAEHEQVASAGVFVDEISPGNRVLRGFYEARGDAAPDPGEVKEFLSRKLPGYMIPATLTAVPDVPMTTSGKIDRPALARLEPAPSGPHRAEGPDASPVSEDLLLVWKAVLGDVPFGPDESFFDLGGNSFSLVLLLEKLNAVHPGVLDMSDLFAEPTLGGQQRLLERRQARDRSADAVADLGMRLPAAWFAAGRGADGIAEAALPANAAAALRRPVGDDGRTAQALAHAAFALTVGKTLSRDSVTLCVVTGPDRAVPVRLDLAGRADLSELVDDYLRLVGDPDRAVGLDRVRPGRGEDGTVTIACADHRRTAGSDLLQHADLVLGTALTGRRAAVTLAHRHEIDPEAVHRLLRGYVRLLGAVGTATTADGTPATPRAADAALARPHVSDRKDQS